MATNNFYKRNTSYYYVISDEWLDDLDYIREQLLAVLEKRLKRFRNAIVFDDVYHHVRTYGISNEYALISMVGISYSTDDDYSVRFYVGIRYGYYTGANLDYEIKMVDNYDGYEWEFDDSKFKEHILKSIWKICDIIENTLKEFSDTVLAKVGGLSNGEAIYKEVKE